MHASIAAPVAVVVAWVSHLGCASAQGGAGSTAAGSPAPPVRRSADRTNPVVATQQMMLAIADGRLPLDRFVDPLVGVVFIDHSPDASGEAAPREAPRLECGAELAALVARWRRGGRASDHGIRRAYEEGFLECRNRPGPPTCTYGRSMEWDPAIHFIFRLDSAKGLMLQAITLDDEAAVAPENVAAEHRAQARLIARLSARGCGPAR